jgi:carboxyl-terminal processing protease
VIRLGALLLLLLAFPAKAEPPMPSLSFNAGLVTRIYAAALDFIGPRALQPVTVPELTVWGLRGLTAIDPQMVAVEASGQLVLGRARRVIYAGAPPPEPNALAWADVATEMTQAGWNASPALRHAGTQPIVQSFFDDMFNHLDPYSRYVPPGLAAEEEEMRIGSAGIGTTLTGRGGETLVESVLPNTPAANAGLQPGDRILSVDGKSVKGQHAATVSGWIAGPEEGSVTVIWRGTGGRRQQADIVRAIIPRRTVFPGQVGKVLVVRLDGFARDTAESVATVVARALDARHPPPGIVLDLRGNRGGLLAEAVTVADEFLPAGVVAIERGRDPASNRIWQSESGELAKDVPLVVLVDGRTASAAEVLAAALADRGRAVVVGSSTLGKGLVQTFTTLPDGGELFVTWSRMLAPRGWPIQGLGVLPQVCTSLGDAALQRQLQSLAAGLQPMAAAIEQERTAPPDIGASRIIAIRDACPAAEENDSDLDAANILISNPAAYAAALLPPLRTTARGD